MRQRWAPASPMRPQTPARPPAPCALKLPPFRLCHHSPDSHSGPSQSSGPCHAPPNAPQSLPAEPPPPPPPPPYRISLQGKILELVPRIDRQVCLVLGSDAAASSSNGDDADQHALPDVRGWRYAGVQELEGEETHLWEYEARWVGRGAGLAETGMCAGLASLIVAHHSAPPKCLMQCNALLQARRQAHCVPLFCDRRRGAAPAAHARPERAVGRAF
jgi:hypothetical protein